MVEEVPLQQGPEITLIQKTWRGFLARRRTKIHAEEIKVDDSSSSIIGQNSRQSSKLRKLKVPPRTPPRGNSTKFEPKDVLPQSTKEPEKIPFLKSTDLDVVIDGALGLPRTTTLARIRVELHMPTKEILELKSPYAYSDFLSEHTSPRFALKMHWKGRMLHPTMTIVCRIETLEAPLLEPRCIGIAALRLCVDLLGMQPLSEVLSDGKPSCFFNAGQFMVPILYGTFPQDIQFATESKIQFACPHIDGAYLRMSINPLVGGEKVATPGGSPFGNSRKAMNIPSQSVRSSNYHSSAMEFQQELNAAANASVDPWSVPSYSVGSVLLKTYIGSEKEISPPLLSVPEVLLDKFREGTIFDIGEKQEIRNAIVRWSQDRFDENTEPTEAINRMYLLEYSETCGCNATLDMLYNMPDRNKLTQAAERAAHVAAMRSGLIRGWDSQLNYYKTIFRYLPGSVSASQSRKEDVNDKSRDLKMVVDDASVRPVFESPEQCPAFSDDFSSTEGLRLGPHACLLVVVTAVDVLISRKVAAQRDKYSGSDLNTSSDRERDPSYLSPMNSKASIFSEDASTRIAEKKLKMSKLKGLKGIYVGTKDPKSTWWGILPLFTAFPNPLIDKAAGGLSSPSRVDSNAVVGGQGESNNNNNNNNNNNSKQSSSKRLLSPKSDPNIGKEGKNISGVPPVKGERDQSDFTVQGTEAGGVSNQPSSEENSPALKGNNSFGLQPSGSSGSALLSSLATLPMFVNSGSHQIPLFRGLPPEDMINAPNPMVWLITKIYTQLNRGPAAQSRLSLLPSPLTLLMFPCAPCLGVDAQQAAAEPGNTSAVSNLVRPGMAVPAITATGGGGNNAGNSMDSNNNKNTNQLNNSGKENDSTSMQRAQSATTAAFLRNMSSRMDLNAIVDDDNNRGSGNTGGKKSKKKKGKKAKNVDIVLSDGASAIIRIVDPRVKRLALYHAAITPSTVNNLIPGSLGSMKITSIVSAANVVRASLRVSQKANNSAGVGGLTGGGMGASDGTGLIDTLAGSNMTSGVFPSSDGAMHSISPTLLPMRNEVLEEVLLLHAHSVSEKGASVVLDSHRLRTLRQNFAVHPSKFMKKKTVKSAIPETMDANYLIQEINTKFYEVISS